MSEGIEAATNAFAADLQVDKPARREGRASETAPKPEPVFGNSRKMEGDEEAPAPKPKAAKPAEKPKPKETTKPDEGDDEAVDHGEETDDGEGGDKESEVLEAGRDEGDEGDDDEAPVPGDEEDDEDDEQEEVVKRLGYNPKQVVKVKIDGEEAELSLEDAINGGIRMKTFHKRMQGLTDTAKAVRARAEEVNGLHEKYSGLCDALEQELDNLMPAEPNWGDVFAQLPKEQANAQYQAYQKLKADRAAIKAQREQLTKETDGRKAQMSQEQLRQANLQMLEDHPEWSDPVNGQATYQRDRSNMVELSKHVGITDQEFSSLSDPRYIRILNMAAKYHKLQSRKPAAQERQTKPSRPGAGTNKAALKGKQNTAAKLARSGRVQDAADHFGVILAQER